MDAISVPPYPLVHVVNGSPTNLAMNKTPEGVFQVVRVIRPGGPCEGDYELLFQGEIKDCANFLRQQLKQDFPGLLKEDDSVHDRVKGLARCQQ